MGTENPEFEGTVAIDRENVRGARITPHMYTMTSELDTLVRALKELASA